MEWIIFLPIIKTLFNIAITIIPIRILIEFIEEYKLIEKIEKHTHFMTNWFEITTKSLIPMISGWILGMFAGSSVLADYHFDKKITQDETNKVMSIWMFAHGLIDETALYVILGANMFWILGVRIFFAIFAVKALIILSKKGFNITI